MSNYVVAIDAGHGMNTSGKQSCPMKDNLYIGGLLVRQKGQVIKENEFNRGVATFLAKALERCGIGHFYTADMTGNTDTPLSTRTQKANNAKCDIFVSCHYNALGSLWQSKAHGLLVLRTANCSQNSIKLGQLVTAQLEKDIKYSYSYGLKKDTDINSYTLAVLRQSTMPAILIEYGFMDYEPEAILMLDTAYQKKLAESTCVAICSYFNVAYKAEEVVSNESFVVKITTDSLNIRSGPSTSYPIVGVVSKGEAFTITKVSGSWGYLKSGKGYINISSSYVTRL